MASLKNQLRAGPGWFPVLLVNLLLLGIAYVVPDKTWAMLVLVSITMVITARFSVFAHKWRKYLLTLRARINLPNEPGPSSNSLERTRRD